jgi:hypothetical protein
MFHVKHRGWAERRRGAAALKKAILQNNPMHQKIAF